MIYRFGKGTTNLVSLEATAGFHQIPPNISIFDALSRNPIRLLVLYKFTTDKVDDVDEVNPTYKLRSFTMFT